MARRRRKGRRRSRRSSRLTTGLRGSALQVATGAVTSLGHQVLAERVEAIRDNWWAGGAVLCGVGFLLKRRRKVSSLGDAMLGAGGYALGLTYQMRRSAAQTGALLSPGDLAGLEGGQWSPIDDQLNPISSHYRDPGASMSADISDAEALEV